jgi:hypothetical protein
MCSLYVMRKINSLLRGLLVRRNVSYSKTTQKILNFDIGEGILKFFRRIQYWKVSVQYTSHFCLKHSCKIHI